MISPGSASLTRIDAISPNCWLNWEVKLAGICCTSKTAPGKSFGKEGINFISVAGPPVEAAIMTIGNLPLDFAGVPATADENAVLIVLGASATLDGRELIAFIAPA